MVIKYGVPIFSFFYCMFFRNINDQIFLSGVFLSKYNLLSIPLILPLISDLCVVQLTSTNKIPLCQY